MKIDKDQIATTENFGTLDGRPVNLVVLRGGLNLATTKDAKGEEKVLGASSHRAILSYSVEQRFSSFQPAMNKSEGVKLSAESHSHFLTDDLRKSGHDIYSIQNGDKIDFFITKQSIKVGGATASISGKTLLIKSMDSTLEFTHPLSCAVSEKTLSAGLKIVKVK